MEVIDLTHLMTNGMPVFPGSKPVLLNMLSTIESGGYNETDLHISTHTGTHVDCGRHLINSGFTTDSAEAGRFCGKGLVIDCRSENRITADFLFRFDGRIREADFVILFTGWSKHWGSPEYFKRFPVPDEKAAAYLAECSLKGAGIDGPSFDPLESVHLPVHISFVVSRNCTHRKPDQY